MGDFATFAALQGISFVVAVVNIRALAHLQYGWAVLTDGLICWLGWTLFQKLKEANSTPAKVGYIVGGMAGSLVGMWVTRVWG